MFDYVWILSGQLVYLCNVGRGGRGGGKGVGAFTSSQGYFSTLENLAGKKSQMVIREHYGSHTVQE